MYDCARSAIFAVHPRPILVVMVRLLDFINFFLGRKHTDKAGGFSGVCVTEI